MKDQILKAGGTSWEDLDQAWDMIVVGGGISGAGVLQEAARCGAKALLIEARDFASGTSSRSGRLVHGGIRYLREHQFGVSFTSVRERERLLSELPGLVNPVSVSYLCMSSDQSPCWRLGADILVYEAFAGRRMQGRKSKTATRDTEPMVSVPGLRGSYAYTEGLTDDSRLVMRVIRDAVSLGAFCRNYSPAVGVLRQQNGRVSGVVVEDRHPDHQGRTLELQAKVVVNATGYMADELRAKVGGDKRIRMARGSHLNFPWDRLPVRGGVCYYHPRDQRIQFVMPWKGAVIAGTTDLDHGLDDENPLGEPSISDQEVEYILEGLAHAFPKAGLGRGDVLSTYSGVRPIIRSGAASPDQESRRHSVWDEHGMVTIAGGKLTTYRVMARDTLRRAGRYLPQDGARPAKPRQPVSVDLGAISRVADRSRAVRLVGKYGKDAVEIISASGPDELAEVGKTDTTWAELRWAARNESVVHLEDLMLRRVRLGLLLPEGGIRELQRIRGLVASELNWGDSRWASEVEAYRKLWRQNYSLPR